MDDFIEYIRVTGKYHYDYGFDIPVIGSILWLIYYIIVSGLYFFYMIVSFPALICGYGIEKIVATHIMDEDMNNFTKLIINIFLLVFGFLIWLGIFYTIRIVKSFI